MKKITEGMVKCAFQAAKEMPVCHIEPYHPTSNSDFSTTTSPVS